MELDLAAVLQRVEERLKELGMSDRKASIASGHPDVIKNLRTAIRTGKGGPTVRVLDDLARALQTSSAALLEGDNGRGAPLQRVIAELEAKRDKIDETIRSLKELHHLK